MGLKGHYWESIVFLNVFLSSKLDVLILKEIQLWLALVSKLVTYGILARSAIIRHLKSFQGYSRDTNSTRLDNKSSSSSEHPKG